MVHSRSDANFRAGLSCQLLLRNDVGVVLQSRDDDRHLFAGDKPTFNALNIRWREMHSGLDRLAFENKLCTFNYFSAR